MESAPTTTEPPVHRMPHQSLPTYRLAALLAASIARVDYIYWAVISVTSIHNGTIVELGGYRYLERGPNKGNIEYQKLGRIKVFVSPEQHDLAKRLLNNGYVMP